MMPWFYRDGGYGWFVRIPLLVGQISIKPARYSFFSERTKRVPTFVWLGLRFTWRKWRASAALAQQGKAGADG